MSKFVVFMHPVHDVVIGQGKEDDARNQAFEALQHEGETRPPRRHELFSEHHEVNEKGHIVQSQASRERDAAEAARSNAGEEVTAGEPAPEAFDGDYRRRTDASESEAIVIDESEIDESEPGS